MAPEQFSGRPAGQPTDIYALGIVLFELVAGRLPYNDVKTLRSVITERTLVVPPLFRELGANVPPAWDAAVQRCLRLAPHERFDRASTLVEILRQELGAARSLVPTSATHGCGGSVAGCDSGGHPFRNAAASSQNGCAIPDSDHAAKVAHFTAQAPIQELADSNHEAALATTAPFPGSASAAATPGQGQGAHARRVQHRARAVGDSFPPPAPHRRTQRPSREETRPSIRSRSRCWTRRACAPCPCPGVAAAEAGARNGAVVANRGFVVESASS